jgi:phage tail sheath protein FI
MPEYTAPGVYVEEVSFRARSIEGVPTTTTGFVGTATNGPVGRAVQVRSVAEFVQAFGSAEAVSDLGRAVQLFFANGGAHAWVVALGPDKNVDEGLAALDRVPGLAILNLPGRSDRDSVRLALQYAQRRRAFVVIDPPGSDPEEARALVRDLAETGVANGAVYFPPLLVADPVSGQDVVCPPGGAVAGVFSRTDASRGPWKAPAGLEASVLGATGLAAELDDAATETLNRRGVSVLRSFPGVAPLVWGSRTIQGADESASEWKYVPVRRLASFLEASLDRGTRWAVFEPNDEPLWASLRLSVGAFIDGLFKAGAFQGRTPREAWFVRCDATTMTQDDLDRGMVNVVVGFAPLKPAEFVVIRIQQMTARTTVEQLGPSTGEPGQRIALAHRPVVQEGFLLQVETEHGWTAWTRVDSFDGSEGRDTVFALDAATGTIAFGDGERGAIPPARARIEAQYRYGAGSSGDP